MKLKKILAMFMAAMLVVGLLAACSGGSTEAPAEEATEEAADEAAEATDDAAAETEDAADATEEAATVDGSGLKVGCLLPGSANDGGWSQLAADAVTAAADEFGCETNFSESVAATDYESTLRGYADAGYNIIVAHGAEFLDAVKLVAPDYPDVQFINTSANKGQAPNVAAIDFGSYQLGALSGYVAALASDNGKIGIIGALEGETTLIAFDMTEKTAKYANPDIEVVTAFTGSYDDQLKAKQAAQELIAQGCDVLVVNADAATIGAIQQCDEDGAICIPQAMDYHEEGESVMCACPQYVGVGITAAVEKAIEGTLESSDGATTMGAAEGVNVFVGYFGTYADKLTDEEKAVVQGIYDEALAGGLLTEEAIDEYFSAL